MAECSSPIGLPIATTQSPTLDNLGGFARTVEDVALLHDALAGFDEKDPAMRLVARPGLLATARSAPPVRPALAFVRGPHWDDTEADLREGFAELIAELGDVEEVALPDIFSRAVELHRTIHLADLAKHYARYYQKDREQLSPRLREMIEEGQRVLAVDYNIAHDWIEILNAGLEEVFQRADNTGHIRAGARYRDHRQPDLLHPLDPLRVTRPQSSPACRQGRSADRRTVGRQSRS